MPFAVQLDVEKFLQIDVTNEPDAAVDMLLENATGIIKSYIERDLELTVYTAELHDPPPDSNLWLDNWPINESVTPVAVTENATVLTVTTDYLVYLEEGKIVRVSPAARRRDWRPKDQLQAISVTYDAGYDFTIDPLIEPEAVVARDVCTRIAARVFQAAAAYANAPVAAAGLKSLTLVGSDSVRFADAVSGKGGVTEAAVQLTAADRHTLQALRRKVLVT